MNKRRSFTPMRRLTLCSALALAACTSMAPDHQRPAAPVPTQFPQASAAKPSASAPAAADIAWQDFFADARLQALIQAALANNRDLRVALLNVEQTRAQFQIRRADLLPTVNASVSASRQPSVVNGNLTNNFSAGASISAWEVDFFGRLDSLKDQALAQYLATEEARKAAQISLVAAVASGWLTLQADEDLLELTRQTLSSREESLRLVRLRVDHGASSELDWRAAQTLVEGARASLAQLQRQRALDVNALALLVGQSVAPDLLPSGSAMRLNALSLRDVPEGLPSDLLNRRPDIRQAEQALVAANANIGAARANFFPRISLTASAGTSSKELTGLFKSGSWGFSLNPQLLLPIFDSGRNQANLDAAKVGKDIAVAQYEKAIQTAFREVADALVGKTLLAEQLQAQQAQAQAEAERLKLSELRYRNGVASQIELLDAQRSLYTAQQAVIQTLLARLQAQVQLYKSLGGGWKASTTG